MGHLSTSTSTLAFDFPCPGPNTVEPKTVRLTNDGNAAIDWTSSSDSARLSIAPTGSTLPAGAHIDVTVSRLGLPPAPPFWETLIGQVHFQAVAPGAAPLDVDVTEGSGGYYAPPRANLDFGDVYASTTPTLQIAADSSVVGEVLSSSNPRFTLNGFVPSEQGKWTLGLNTFPVALGQQTTTLTFGSMFGCVLSPNTFTAKANVLYDTTCTHVSDGGPCSPTASCVSGVCGGTGGSGGNDGSFTCVGDTPPTTAADPLYVYGHLWSGGPQLADAKVTPITATVGQTVTTKIGDLFTISLATGGVPLNVYFKATSSGFLDSYFFPAGALTKENNPGLNLPLVYPIEVSNAAFGAGVTLQSDRATLALQIVDCLGTLMSAAQVTITQSSSNVGDLVTDLAALHSSQFSPSLMTMLALNVPAGQTTVTAKVGQYSLRPTTITAVANALNVVRLAP
jgi:hypothetical protein